MTDYQNEDSRDIDIDSLLRNMAKDDGYNARKLFGPAPLTDLDYAEMIAAEQSIEFEAMEADPGADRLAQQVVPRHLCRLGRGERDRRHRGRTFACLNLSLTLTTKGI